MSFRFGHQAGKRNNYKIFMKWAKEWRKSDNKKNQKKIVEIAGVGSIVNHPLMKEIEWYHIHPINKSGIGTITFKIKKNKLTK